MLVGPALGSSELRWYCVPGAGSGFNDERARGAPLRALRPGPAGVVDDHAAQEPILAGSAQADAQVAARCPARSEEHTSELQSLMRISYAVFCLKKKQKHTIQ